MPIAVNFFAHFHALCPEFHTSVAQITASWHWAVNIFSECPGLRLLPYLCCRTHWFSTPTNTWCTRQKKICPSCNHLTTYLMCVGTANTEQNGVGCVNTSNDRLVGFMARFKPLQVVVVVSCTPFRAKP